MAIVKCPECQGKVSNQAETCPHCGVSLDICPECGELIKYGIETCPHCGTYLSQTYNDENDVYVEDEIDNDEGGSFLGKLLRLVAGIFGWLFEKIALPIISVFIVLAIMIGVFNLCTNAINNTEEKTEQKEAKKTSFLDIGEKSTYIVNFDKDFILARGAEFTLYKDNSGKIDWISPAHDMNPYKECEWTDSEFKNPMSKGGDGNPLPVICVTWHNQIYAIDENKDVYWSTDNTFIKVGKATKR